MTGATRKQDAVVALTAALPALIPLITLVALSAAVEPASTAEQDLAGSRVVRAVIFVLGSVGVGGVAAASTRQLGALWMRLGISVGAGFVLTNVLYRFFYR